MCVWTGGRLRNDFSHHEPKQYGRDALKNCCQFLVTGAISAGESEAAMIPKLYILNKHEKNSNDSFNDASADGNGTESCDS